MYNKNLPSVFDKTGSAELSTRTREQLTIIRLNGVFLGLGLMHFIIGEVYSPTEDVAIIYNIVIISIAAPNGPNFESELTPNVNCWKINLSFRIERQENTVLTLVLLGKALIPINKRTVFCITNNTATPVIPISKSIATGYKTFLLSEEV